MLISFASDDKNRPGNKSSMSHHPIFIVISFQVALLIGKSDSFVIPGGLVVDRDETKLEFVDTSRTVLVKLGETAELPCQVKNLGENVVSWIRQYDLQVLTSGSLIFTTDSRFQLDSSASGSRNTNWNLRLYSAVANDAGIYECQINTEPKMKRSVTLLVAPGNFANDATYDDSDFNETSNDLTAEMKSSLPLLEQSAKISGPSEHHVLCGSAITLTCEVRISEGTVKRSSPTTEDYSAQSELQVQHYSKYKRCLSWYQNNKLLTFRSANAGSVVIETERYPDVMISRLTITSLTSTDSGEYICKPLYGQSANVTVHVVQESEEDVQAMQPENFFKYNKSTASPTVKHIPIYVSFLYFLFHIRFNVCLLN